MKGWGRGKRLSSRKKAALIFAAVAAIVYFFALPDRIFDDPYSTVLQARDGRLLSAFIAEDGQWRFPETDAVPRRFAEALIVFEDKRFYYHPGIDPMSLLRALHQNLRQGKVVSGGSTITMQVIRLSRAPTSRSLLEKLIEMILATRLELSRTKEEVLALYASHAPFGGNVVGLDAACWRYFGRGAENLSWGEAALLAVLPNAPSLIHPGKNRDALKIKRDNLLDRLLAAGKIDSLTCALSKSEPVPEKPRPVPQMARHLLARIKKEGGKQRRVTATIDYHMQERVETRLQEYHDRLRSNRINNGAVLILDNATGEAIAYAGNVYGDSGGHGTEVDIIGARRSTGSILKPFLYAACLDEGLLLPRTLVPDIPVMMNGFTPQNFSKDYDGAVPANEALIRSLNVPFVFLLKDYRYEKFYSLLHNMGFTRMPKDPDHYGLSLILGGAEGSLWDITGMYASMARTLSNYFEHPGAHRYRRSDFHAPRYVKGHGSSSGPRAETSWLSAASIYLTFETLKELYRPAEESGWRYFRTAKQIAWKTGTSFGFRDAWAIGVTPTHTVGVWIGNADGEGRPGLTGTGAAAPLLFDIFSMLPGTPWFKVPHSELEPVVACRKSGERAAALCGQVDSIRVPVRGLETRACARHKLVHLSRDRKHRVHSACARMDEMVHEPWFVLAPVQEYYFRSKHISYKPLPPYRAACAPSNARPPMELIYPKPGARILIPRDFDGHAGSTVFELAHADERIAVFWHLDGTFMGVTRGAHRLALNPPAGRHVLTVVDENGQALEESFTVLSAL